MIDPILAYVTAPSLIIATVALFPRRLDPTLAKPTADVTVRPAHIIDDELLTDFQEPRRRPWFQGFTLPRFRFPFHRPRQSDVSDPDVADTTPGDAVDEKAQVYEAIEEQSPEQVPVAAIDAVALPASFTLTDRGDIQELKSANDGPTDADFLRFSQAREIEALRHQHAIAELALAATTAPTLWISALLPDAALEDTATRLRAIHHLALLPRTSFAPSVLLRALESEPEPFIRARILGALAGTNSLTDEIAAAAAERSDIEASAVAELRTPVTSNDDSQNTVESS